METAAQQVARRHARHHPGYSPEVDREHLFCLKMLSADCYIGPSRLRFGSAGGRLNLSVACVRALLVGRFEDIAAV